LLQPVAGEREVTKPLLTTKLCVPPPRPRLVPRPHLIERLNAGLPGQGGAFARKLTLISAPAGFGKTTLASSWLHQLEGQHTVASAPLPTSLAVQSAWLSLDEGDNDPARFITYVVAALQTMHADVGQTALAALHSPQPPSLEALLTALINDIATVPGRPMVLVLDDYQVISAQPIHDGLTYLLDHLPPNLHLVIATRSDPPNRASARTGPAE
jgi:LuxR family maltose regulon positive regulatory protein